MRRDGETIMEQQSTCGCGDGGCDGRSGERGGRGEGERRGRDMAAATAEEKQKHSEVKLGFFLRWVSFFLVSFFSRFFLRQLPKQNVFSSTKLGLG